MKKAIILAVAMVSLSLTSCSKSPEKVLPKKDGKWNVAGTVTNSTFAISLPVTGNITFNDDKSFASTLSISGFGSESSKGTWSATKETVTTISNGTTVIYTVVEAKTKSEKWENVSTKNGTTVTTKLDLTK